MNRIEVVRVAALRSSTIGVIKLNGFPFCACLEQDWEDNQRNVSCIPPGTYKAEVWYSDKYNCTTIRLHGVPGRSDILFHPGNFPSDTKGCILPGLSFQPGMEMVGTSRPATKALIAALDGDTEITVTITDYTREQL